MFHYTVTIQEQGKATQIVSTSTSEDQALEDWLYQLEHVHPTTTVTLISHGER